MGSEGYMGKIGLYPVTVRVMFFCRTIPRGATRGPIHLSHADTQTDQKTDLFTHNTFFTASGYAVFIFC